MGTRLVDVNVTPQITASMERAVTGAFNEYSEDAFISVTKRDHLETIRPEGVCCEHSLLPVPASEENTKHLQELFGERDLGNKQVYCSRCGAISLYGGFPDRFRKDDTLWGYDATAKFFGKPRKDRPFDRPRPEGRKPRR
jgi:hypothetical protein